MIKVKYLYTFVLLLSLVMIICDVQASEKIGLSVKKTRTVKTQTISKTQTKPLVTTKQKAVPAIKIITPVIKQKPVRAPRLLKLISPNGGEKLKINSTWKIKWNQNEVKERISIILMQGRKTVTVIARNIKPSVSGFSWRISGRPGSKIVPGENYIIKLSTVDKKITDQSDQPFFIVKSSSANRFSGLHPQTTRRNLQKLPVKTESLKTRNSQNDISPSPPGTTKLSADAKTGHDGKLTLAAKQTMRAVKFAPKVPAHSPVPLILTDNGVRILTPGSSDKYYRGATINIRYQITNDDFSGEEISFTAMNAAGIVVGTTTVSINTNPAPLDLRNNANPGKEYFIMASAEGSPAAISGDSDFFEIQAIGEGHTSSSSPYVRLLSPKGHDYLPLAESQFSVRWRFYGPLEDYPRNWEIEGFHPGEERPVFRRALRCTRPHDEPAADAYGYPSRTCENDVGPIPGGDYILRIHGGEFTDQTRGTFHSGITREWPLIQIFSPTPGRGDFVFMDEMFPLSWTVTPLEAAVEIEIKKGNVVIETRIVTSNSSDCYSPEGVATHCTIEANIPKGSGEGNDYTVVIKSRTHSDAHAESGPFTVRNPPGAPTDPNAIDFYLLGLRVREDGHLDVRVRVLPPTSSLLRSAIRARYTLPFLVRLSSSASGHRVDRDVPTSVGEYWIDLGHINRFSSNEERRLASTRMAIDINVLVNITPNVVTETSYNNNDVTVRSRWLKNPITIATDPLDKFSYNASLNRITGAVFINNYGYNPASVIMHVRQKFTNGGHRDLGQREFTIPPPGPGHLFYHRENEVFVAPIHRPELRPGRIELIFSGDCYIINKSERTLSMPFQSNEPNTGRLGE